MLRAFDVIIEGDSEGYYVTTVPALRGCHTQAKPLDALTKRAQEAIHLCVEAEGAPADTPRFVGTQRVLVEV